MQNAFIVILTLTYTHQGHRVEITEYVSITVFEEAWPALKTT